MSNISPQEKTLRVTVSTKWMPQRELTQPPLSNGEKMLIKDISCPKIHGGVFGDIGSDIETILMPEPFSSDVGSVERNLLVMMNVLSKADQNLFVIGLSEKLNLDNSVIMRGFDEIDVYLVDPDRFGSKSVIGKLHSILLEATQ